VVRLRERKITKTRWYCDEKAERNCNVRGGELTIDSIETVGVVKTVQGSQKKQR
jgi:hypothetical protein